MKRLFAAIKVTPDENFLKIYYGLIKELHFAKVNWVKPENMHLTLKFFGETSEEKVEQINQVIEESLENFAPFIIHLKETGIFGSSYNPKVIWFGVGNAEILKKMAENLLISLDENGFLRDRQNFVPHLTVGRIKDVKHKQLFQSAVDKYKGSFIQEILVDSIILFESVLTPKGPQYKKISEHRLKA
ncbi:MAG TPA: RNA 2',3'-cyclic phosphodiesterase [Bacteroidales bacterium]